MMNSLAINSLKSYISGYMMLGIIIILVIGMVSAEQTLGTFKQDTCISLKQTCANCTFVNVTSVIAPDSDKMLDNVVMTKLGTEYNYSFCNTSDLGEYIYNTVGDVNGLLVTQPVSFIITPSGTGQINSGEGLTLIGSLVVLILIGIFFFVLAINFNVIGKVIFFTLSGIMLIIAILFSTVALQQTLGGFESIIESYSSFWFVVKIIFSVFLTALVIFAGYSAYRLWLKQRGFRD